MPCTPYLGSDGLDRVSVRKGTTERMCVHTVKHIHTLTIHSPFVHVVLEVPGLGNIQ